MKKMSMMSCVLLLGLIGCSNNGAQPEGEGPVADLILPAASTIEGAQQLPESESDEVQVVVVEEPIDVPVDAASVQEPSTVEVQEEIEQEAEHQDESAGEGASADEGSWWRWMLRNLPRR